MKPYTKYGLFLGAFTAFFLYFSLSVSFAQPPTGYYNSAENLIGAELKVALHNIIKDHEPRTYAQLWQDFAILDRKPNEKVWDMYSDVPGGTPAYEFTFFTNQCGNYNAEGQCYNREHSWPASWFSNQHPMYTDLFHIVPTDGYVNNRRGSFPFGEVGQTTWVSTNGSRVGQSITQGYSGVVFEPIDAYKGDFARGIMYMNVRYYSQDGNWPGSDMTDGAELLGWAKALMLKWHNQDPVSQKEINRNNGIFAIQQNRNPFIDRPEFAALIFDPTASVNESSLTLASLDIWPNPSNGELQLRCYYCSNTSAEVLLTDITGKTLSLKPLDDPKSVSLIDVSWLESGFYFVSILQNNRIVTTSKLIKN
ncbi:MAG: endonuclease [Bacteroidetes bacterium]|nr:endonuclease [Bacteroidota bacterium]